MCQTPITAAFIESIWPKGTMDKEIDVALHEIAIQQLVIQTCPKVGSVVESRKKNLKLEVTKHMLVSV